MEFISAFGLDTFSLIVGAISALMLGPGCKSVIMTIFPQTAPFFALFNKGQRELSQVINAATSKLHKNADLQEWARTKGLKVAANLIKK